MGVSTVMDFIAWSIQIKNLDEISNVAGYIVLFSYAYVIGLINIVLCKFLWSGMEKNIGMMEYCRNKAFQRKAKNMCSYFPYIFVQSCILFVAAWNMWKRTIL